MSSKNWFRRPRAVLGRLEQLEDRAVPATHTWSGAISDSWSVAGNWTGGVPTNAEPGGTVVTFGAGDLTCNMDIVGLVVDQINFVNGSNTVTLTTPLGLNTAVLPLNLLSAGGTNRITGSTLAVTGAAAAVAQIDGGTTTIASTVTDIGGGLTKTGAGILGLSAANSSYAGNVTVAAGTLLATGGNMIPDAIIGSLGNPQAPNRTITVATGATLSFGTFDIFGNGFSTPTVTLVIGGTVTNTGNFFNTLGDVQLTGGTFTSVGGLQSNFQAWSLRGNVTVGGTTPSTISSSGTNGGIHLGANTIVTVPDITGSAAPDLLITGTLLNQSGDQGSAAAALTFNGAGTIVSTGASNYTGTTTIGSGVLQIGNGGTTGTLGSGPVTNNGTLVVSNSNVVIVSGPISGTGAVRVATGYLTLKAASTYTGGTVVTDGTIYYEVSGALGTGPIQLGDANTPVVAFPRIEANATVDTTLTNPIVVNHTGAVVGGLFTSGAPVVTYTGTITLNIPGGLLFLHAGSAARTVFAGRITGDGGVAPWSPSEIGHVIVFDNAAGSNDYTGGTFIYDDAVLQLGLSSSQEQLPNAGGVTFINDGSMLRLNRLSETIGGLSGAGGQVITSGVGRSTLTLAGPGFFGFGGSVANGTNTLAVVKTGPGEQELGGLVAASGTVLVSDGTLRLDGPTVASVFVSGTGSLGGTGSIVGGLNVQSGGTLIPGTNGTAGTLTATAFAAQTGGTFRADVLGAGAGAYDQVVVNGTAVLGGALSVVPTAGLALPAGTVLTILQATGTLTGTFDNLPEGTIFTPGGAGTQVFRISYLGGNVTLSTPEANIPTAALGAAPDIGALPPLGDYTLTVLYTDDTAIDATSLSDGDVRVTGPNGFNVPLTFVAASGTNPLTGTYSFTPPGGLWDVTDNGVYTISSVASSVADAFGNLVAGGVLGAFTVAVRPTLYPTLLTTGVGNGSGTQFTPRGTDYSLGQGVALVPGFTGDLHVAVGDVNGDGVPDRVVGTGPGAARVRVLSGADDSVLADFTAFAGYTGGVFVAAGDLDNDGLADVAVTPDATDAFSGPVDRQLPVRVYTGASMTNGTTSPTLLASFDGLASLTGASGQAAGTKLGGRVAIGDVNGDGLPDLLIAAGNGGGPRITIWNGTGFAAAAGGKPTSNPLANLFVFESTQRGGAFVASGDVNGDNRTDVVVGGGPGGGPRVRIVDSAKLLALPNLESVDLDQPSNLANGLVLNNYFAGSATNRGGVHVTVKDVDGDGSADVITGSGAGEASAVRVYKATALAAAFGTNNEPANPQTFDPFGLTLPGGVWVG